LIMPRTFILTILVGLAAGGWATADGGVPIASAARHGLRVTVFVDPANPTVGAIDVSILVQDATSEAVRMDVPARVEALSHDANGLVVVGMPTISAATNRLLRAATLDLPVPGRWTLTTTVGDLVVQAELTVRPASEAWSDLWLWIGWPFAALVLVEVHRRRVLAVDRRHHMTTWTPTAGANRAAR